MIRSKSKKTLLKYMHEVNAYACVRYFSEGFMRVNYVFSRNSLFYFLNYLADFCLLDLEIICNPYYEQH